MSSKPLLNDPNTPPDKDLLKKALDKAYPVFQDYILSISKEPRQLSPEWRFYKDGNAWLCKVVRKKKTVHWISIWPGYFKVAFYFTEKTGSGIGELKIPEGLKNSYDTAKSIGKLKPLVIDVRSKSDLSTCYEVVDYKISKL